MNWRLEKIGYSIDGSFIQIDIRDGGFFQIDIRYSGTNLRLNPFDGNRWYQKRGGTGIIPIYQVMQAILKDPEDETEMYVVYANRTEDDILLKEELDSWAEQYSDRVKVWYVVQVAPPEGEEAWKYSVGFIKEETLREHIPLGSKDTLALACGPPSMIQFAVNPNLEKMNYDVKDTLLVF